jgi:hypothetical protein
MVSRLTVLVDVEPLSLDFFAHTKPDHQINELEGNPGNAA